MTQVHSGKGWNLAGPSLLFIEGRRKGRRVRRSAVTLRGDTLNLVSCDAPLPSSLKSFLFRFAPLSISQKSLQRLRICSANSFVSAAERFSAAIPSEKIHRLTRLATEWPSEATRAHHSRQSTHFPLPSAFFGGCRLKSAHWGKTSGWKISE